MQDKIIPFTVESALSEIDKLNQLVDGLLSLGEKIKVNKTQLESVQINLRQIELNNNFFTINEIAEALHCTSKKAVEELRKRNVEIIEAGKSYVVQRDNFINAFRKEVS